MRPSMRSRALVSFVLMMVGTADRGAAQDAGGEFKPISTKVPGIQLSEHMPKLAEQVKRYTLIRSMSYTPSGLFNHTAAIYQMLTGYPPDRVSPSGRACTSVTSRRSAQSIHCV